MRGYTAANAIPGVAMVAEVGLVKAGIRRRPIVNIATGETST